MRHLPPPKSCIRLGWDSFAAISQRASCASASSIFAGISLMTALCLCESLPGGSGPPRSVRKTALWSEPPSHWRRGNFSSTKRPSQFFQSSTGVLMDTEVFYSSRCLRIPYLGHDGCYWVYPAPGSHIGISGLHKKPSLILYLQ